MIFKMRPRFRTFPVLILVVVVLSLYTAYKTGLGTPTAEKGRQGEWNIEYLN